MAESSTTTRPSGSSSWPHPPEQGDRVAADADVAVGQQGAAPAALAGQPRRRRPARWPTPRAHGSAAPPRARRRCPARRGPARPDGRSAGRARSRCRGWARRSGPASRRRCRPPPGPTRRRAAARGRSPTPTTEQGVPCSARAKTAEKDSSRISSVEELRCVMRRPRGARSRRGRSARPGVTGGDRLGVRGGVDVAQRGGRADPQAAALAGHAGCGRGCAAWTSRRPSSAAAWRGSPRASTHQPPSSAGPSTASYSSVAAAASVSRPGVTCGVSMPICTTGPVSGARSRWALTSRVAKSGPRCGTHRPAVDGAGQLVATHRAGQVPREREVAAARPDRRRRRRAGCRAGRPRRPRRPRPARRGRRGGS